MNADPLLRTKTVIPPARPGFVRRPRLTARINEGVKGPLTLLSAPAGFGKTQLLVEWAAERNTPCAWFTLSSEDNDYVQFFRYLGKAFQGIAPRLSEAILDFLQTAESGRIEMATLLINEISAISQDHVLVLDEFHVLDDSSIITAFNFLLKNLPSNLHLVIASRTDQSLDLALLRAKGQVTEIGADDLRLTHEEVRRFFSHTMRLQLPAEALQALEERTEGWAIGLQMAALSLRSAADASELIPGIHGDARYMVEFLAQEVLDRQAEDVRQFLLRSSILDVLTGPLCEAVTGLDSVPGYGTRMLHHLDDLNLFVAPLDEQHQWFRFHNLFAEFLRHMLTATYAAEAPLLHKRAATWFEQQGNLDQAFKHGFATGDLEWVANLIDRNIEGLIEFGEVSTLAHWTKQLPRKYIRQRPRLALAYAWGLTASHQLEDARFWLDDVQRTLDVRGTGQSQPATMTLDERLPQPSLGELALVRSLLAMASGDFRQAAESSRIAVEYLEEGNPFIKSMLFLEESMYSVLLGDTSNAIEALQKAAGIARRANNLFALIVATCQVAEMQGLQGHLSQAQATLKRARLLAIGPNEKPLAIAGIIDKALGEILRECNRLDEAKEYLERGRRLTEAEWAPSSLEAVLSLARLLQSQGEIAEAEALTAAAFELTLSSESGQWDEVVVGGTAVRLALQRGDLPAAHRWWEQSSLHEFSADSNRETHPYHVFEYLLLTQARYDLAVGQAVNDVSLQHQALELLQSILPQAEQYKRVSSQIEILVLRALIEYAIGEGDQATHTLLSALSLGEPEDYRRTFLDEGQVMIELLARCQTEQQQSGAYFPSLQYISSLLDACRQEAGILAPKSPPLSTVSTPEGFDIFLSAREVQVLLLIAQGKSNQEIAEELVLAVNTVKRHAYNIYAKLDAKKRTQAVSKARQLGIIP